MRDGNTITYDVNELTNRYASVGESALEYDAAGNLTKDRLGYGYKFDYENRIAEINDVNGTVVAEFAYDALGRRIKKSDCVADTNTLYYYNDNWQVLCEYSGGGSFERLYMYGNYIDEPIMTYSGGIYFYVQDHLYSTAALVDTGGEIRERYEYDVYGGCIVHTDAGQDGQWMTADDTTDTESGVGNPYMFTGRRYDAESGLCYYRARYYSAEIGRFLQPDPVRYYNDENLYTYVGNRPTNAKDPRGLKTPPNCYKQCKKVYDSMFAPTGCAAKCCKKGSLAVSLCLAGARQGLAICIMGCNDSDDEYDPMPAKKYRLKRAAAYAGCAVRNKGLVMIGVLTVLVGLSSAICFSTGRRLKLTNSRHWK